MKYFFVLLALVYAACSDHYVANGLRTKLVSVGREVWRGIKNMEAHILW